MWFYRKELSTRTVSKYEYFCTEWTTEKYTAVVTLIPRRNIRLIEGNAKCRHLKKLTWKGSGRQVLICLRPPPLLGFCLGCSINFVGSESCQIQSVKLLQNMVSNRTPYHPLLSHSILIHTRKGGGGELNKREGERGNSSQSWVENTNMTEWTQDCYLQSINSDKHLQQSPSTG